MQVTFWSYQPRPLPLHTTISQPLSNAYFSFSPNKQTNKKLKKKKRTKEEEDEEEDKSK